MPLHVLLILVIGGIAGIALLLHLTGRSRTYHLSGPNEALAHWDAAYPASPARTATLAKAGHAALIRHREGLGILWALGQDIVARPLPKHDVQISETKRFLTLHLTDFTAPHIRIALTAEERAPWRAALSEVAT